MSFPAFRGRVIVATGKLDQFAHADGDLVRRTRDRFPGVKSFEWVDAREAGHLVDYHYSARGTYRRVFGLLRG